MNYIIYFAITILILVFVHELGHFIAAKLCKMRVDSFAIGFGKRLFGYNKITGFTTGSLPEDIDLKGNTDYKLNLLPLGGYVKIAGMVDESMDTDFAGKEPAPDEFRSKSTPKKLFVISAGVLMNLLLAIFIFAGINYFQGKQILKTTEIGSISDSSVAAEVGFRTGDRIEAINGEEVNSWDDVVQNMLIKSTGSEVTVTVANEEGERKLNIPSSKIRNASTESFFLPLGNTRPFVSQVLDNSPAMDAGLEAGDIFLAINNNKVSDSREVINIISTHKEETIPLSLLRDKDTLNVSVTPGMDGKIGIGITEAYMGDVDTKTYGLGESFTNSVANIGQYTLLTVNMVKNVIVGDAEFGNNFGGPVKIADMAATSAERGMSSFLGFLALLSLSLAIINILPLPVLDGGHLVIIIIEGIRGRELPLKVKIAIQNAGFFLLLILMVFIIYNDIINL